jgi:putative Mn2+ efflux pump MntP
MSFFIILATALALAMDAFAVTVGISLRPERIAKNQVLRLSIFFGFFQFIMPVLGWAAGLKLMGLIRDVDHWVAFGLLFLVGSKMILESFKAEDRVEKKRADPTKGFTLILLSIATSIDALAVGLGFSALEIPILYPACVIGIVAFFLTAFAAGIGPYIGRKLGRKAGVAGGVILIIIGVKILFDHL